MSIGLPIGFRTLLVELGLIKAESLFWCHADLWDVKPFAQAQSQVVWSTSVLCYAYLFPFLLNATPTDVSYLSPWGRKVLLLWELLSWGETEQSLALTLIPLLFLWWKSPWWRKPQAAHGKWFHGCENSLMHFFFFFHFINLFILTVNIIIY